MIFPILFRACNHQIVNKNNDTEFSLKLSDLKSDMTLTLGYVNPALNNTTTIPLIYKYNKLTTIVDFLVF